jgi:hypothetical protein
MSIFRVLFLAGGLFLLTLSTEGNCATIAAKSPSQADVQAAIQSAAEGDTVSVPAGSASWSGITVGSKALTIQGAGIGATVVTASRAFSLIGVEGKSVRISGFTMRGGGSTVIHVSGTSKTFRIDHIRFEGIAGKAIEVNGYSYGVIDHCQFVGPSVFVGVHVFDTTSNGGVASWNRPLTLGSDKAVYIEDCLFDFGTYGAGVPSVDSRTGGRYVFRYNKVRNQSMGHHDAETQNQRGTFSWEVYGNVFEYSQPLWTAIYMRGGTGVIFDNKFSGSFSMGTPLYMTAYRSSSAGHGAPWYPPCDGTRDYMWSDVSDNCTTPGQKNGNGAVCIQIDGHLDSTGYPCRDQLGRTYDADGDGVQDLSPSYEWNNTSTAGDVEYDWNVPSNVGHHLKLGRDYFADAPKPGYTPLTYPHPLVKGGGSLPAPEVPSAPSGLRIQ